MTSRLHHSREEYESVLIAKNTPSPTSCIKTCSNDNPGGIS